MHQREFQFLLDHARGNAEPLGNVLVRGFLDAGREQFRVGKTTLSHLVKRWARPVYHLVRQLTNRSYEPMSRDSMPDRAGESRTV